MSSKGRQDSTSCSALTPVGHFGPFIESERASERAKSRVASRHAIID